MPTFWGRVFEEVQNTARHFENCAFHAMCERGKNSTMKHDHTGTPGPGGRGNRKLNDKNHLPDGLSSMEHILEALNGFGNNNIPGLPQLKKAYNKGINGGDCDKLYKKCPISVSQVNEMMKNVGEYVFA